MTFGQPSYVTCSDCGLPVEAYKFTEHRCDPERIVDYRMAKLRPELALLEKEFNEWCGTLEGKFSQWDAERRRDR